MFNGQVDLSKLDYDSIKKSLSTYLSTSSEFKDIDFDGSNISALMSLLAYHTYFNAFYDNMILNESFLDSAQKRSSVVSRAKELNYVPHGKRSAKAVVKITASIKDFSRSDVQIIRIPKNSSWNGYNINGKVFNFINKNEIYMYKTTDPVTGELILTSDNINLYNGRMYSYEYLYDDNIPFYEIPNKGIDDSSIEVFVKPSKNSGTYIRYNHANNIVQGISENVFYVQQNSNQRYEIMFGDGVFGNKLTSGNYIHIDYIISDGYDANDCIKFELNSVIDELKGISKVSVVSKSIGGTQDEDIESIKRNAPIKYQSQGRAVTETDFYGAIKEIYPNIKSVSVWGGETNNPPMYGRVLIAVLPDGFPFLSAEERSYIKDKLRKNYSVVGIIPEVMNPDYNDVLLNITVDILSSALPSQSDYENKIKTNIMDYINNVNADFNMVVSDSQIVTLVHNISTAIKHVTVNKSIKKKLIPILNTIMTYEFWYDNEIQPGSISSTWIYISDYTVAVRIYDDGQGNLYLIDKSGHTSLNKVGSVNYNTGYVVLEGLNIVNINEKDPGIIMTPVNPYLNFYFNNVAIVQDKNVVVNYREINVND